jgi:hypothetical protein
LNGAIDDATGVMPDSLKLEADQGFFERALDCAAIVVHGRMSHESLPNSPKRRRLVLTRRSGALSHQPFLLLIAWLPVGLGFNKFNALASRQQAAREPFLVRCDNAGE